MKPQADEAWRRKVEENRYKYFTYRGQPLRSSFGPDPAWLEWFKFDKPTVALVLSVAAIVIALF
jgi:hypothetical protein